MQKWAWLYKQADLIESRRGFYIQKRRCTQKQPLFLKKQELKNRSHIIHNELKKNLSKRQRINHVFLTSNQKNVDLINLYNQAILIKKRTIHICIAERKRERETNEKLAFNSNELSKENNVPHLLRYTGVYTLAIYMLISRR